MPGEQQGDERLSAYLDGELTAAERQEVEVWLTKSPEARRQLDAWRELTGWLSEMPVDPAATDFQESVMCEVAGLKPASLVAQSWGQPVAWRRRLLAGGMVAAALLVLVLYWPSQPGGDDQVAVVPGTPGPMPTAIDAANGDQPGRRDTKTVEAGPVPAEQSPHGNLVFRDQLNGAEVGQVVEALDTSGDQIAVVRLTVVDVERTLDSLRVLLAEHRIGQAPSAEDKTNDRVPRPGLLVAVYVHATDQQLSATLADLKRDVFRELAVVSPLQVASLDASSQAQLGLQVPAAVPVVSPGDVERRANSVEPVEMIKLEALSKLSGATAGKRLSMAAKQVALLVPEVILTGVRPPASKSTTVRQADRAGRIDAETSRSMQVLFVLVAKPDAGDDLEPPESSPDGAS